jgi:5'-phosphate synthase pdxT subunit
MVAMGAIGVLALQGDFREHVEALRRMDVAAREVRRLAELDGTDGLILPGGESTTIGKLMVRAGLDGPIRARAAAGYPIWGTCAGMILLAKDIGGLDQPLLGLMDIRVRRNAFGSQRDSFEADLPMPAVASAPVRAVFIRAPLIEAIQPGVEVLARLADGRIVAARQRNLLATAFHPELTPDRGVHRYFLRLAGAVRG